MTPFEHVLLNLGCAWIAGMVVGWERSYNGRAAGLRTHALVSLAAAAAMVVAYQPPAAYGQWLAPVQLDATRLAPGVLTGIGFLGAGVIFKEGVSVQGLTTAATIWATAVFGLLFGLGLLAPGWITAGAVLLTLTAMRWLEAAVPANAYAIAELRFHSSHTPDEAKLKAKLKSMHAELQDTSFALDVPNQVFVLKGRVQVKSAGAMVKLLPHLEQLPGLISYDLDRIGK